MHKYTHMCALAYAYPPTCEGCMALVRELESILVTALDGEEHVNK